MHAVHTRTLIQWWNYFSFFKITNWISNQIGPCMQRIGAVTTSIPGCVCNSAHEWRGKGALSAGRIRRIRIVLLSAKQYAYRPNIISFKCIINSLEPTYLVDKLVCSFVNSYHILLLNLYNAFRLFKKSLVHF